MRLEDHLHPARVMVGLRARDRAGALGELARGLVEGGVEVPAARLQGALGEREAQQSTVLGRGIAVPHAVLPELDGPVMLVAVTAEPVAFGDPGQEPVRVFFTLLSPPGHEGNHIRLLARICRLGRHAQVLEALAAAPSAEAVLDILLQADRAEA
jgi:nitrogen PTS system EIIA component